MNQVLDNEVQHQNEKVGYTEESYIDTITAAQIQP